MRGGTFLITAGGLAAAIACTAKILRNHLLDREIHFSHISKSFSGDEGDASPVLHMQHRKRTPAADERREGRLRSRGRVLSLRTAKLHLLVHIRTL
jgi:hypothetical protein